MKRRCLLVLLLPLAILFAAPALAFEKVTPSQAYALATDDPNAYILDVRTAAEWQWVGHPGKNKAGDGAELEGKVVNVSWMIERKGAMIVNPSFLSDVDEIFQRQADVLLITLCRSGSRSTAAALRLEEAGYKVAEISVGFEGGTDQYGYRTVNGWKVEGWPYNFSATGAYTLDNRGFHYGHRND